MQSEYLDQNSIINASQDSFEEGGYTDQMLAAAMGYNNRNPGMQTSSGFTQQDEQSNDYTSFYHQQLQQVIQQQNMDHIIQGASLFPPENDKQFDEPLPVHQEQALIQEEEEAPTMYVTKRRKIDHN